MFIKIVLDRIFILLTHKVNLVFYVKPGDEVDVGDLEIWSKEFCSIRKVLIAYSGSMESAKAMRRYVQLNPWRNVQLRVVYFGASDEAADQLLKDAVEYCRDHGFNAETESVDKSAKDHLIEYAQQNDMDMIVMGNRIRNLIIMHFLGDTVLNAIQQSDRPLFLAQ